MHDNDRGGVPVESRPALVNCSLPHRIHGTTTPVHRDQRLAWDLPIVLQQNPPDTQTPVIPIVIFPRVTALLPTHYTVEPSLRWEILS